MSDRVSSKTNGDEVNLARRQGRASNFYRLEFANTLRGVAALTVLLFHYLGVFWLNRDSVAYYTHMQPLSLAHYPNPFFTPWTQVLWVNLGAFGVGLFFLISGFVIPFSLIDRSRANFVVARFWRLFPTYAVGFTLTVFALLVATKVLGNTFPYSLREVAAHYLLGLRDFIGTRSIDGIIWTLEVEIKFYFIAFVLADLLRRGSVCLVWLVILGSAVSYLYVSNLSYFGREWPTLNSMIAPFALSARYLTLLFIGMFLNFYYRDTIGLRQTVLCVTACLSCTVLLWPSFSGDQLPALAGYLLAVPVFFLCYAMRDRFKSHPAPEFLSRISYPLYVVHGVAGYLLITALLKVGTASVFAVAVTAICAVFVAYILHRFVELPMQVRERKRDPAPHQ